MTERVKRPKLERTEPIRNWATLLGSAAPSGAGVLNDVIARSVDLGYRVVDEYVRQGQKAAQRLSGGVPDAAGVSSDMQELAARMAQYTSGFMSLWFEMMSAAMANPDAWSSGWAPARPPAAAAGTPVAGTGAPAPADAGAAASTGEPTRVRVELASAQPVEVGFDLRPGAGRAPFIVHALRAVDAAKPPIAATAVADGADGVLRVRVHVPDDQPPGVYSGLLIEEHSGLPIGSLSLRVGCA